MTAPGSVEGTGLFAVELGYTVTLVKDATAAYSKVIMPASHQLTDPFCARAILTIDELIAVLPRN
jgi:nicotinamidase-related amidase